MVALLTILLWLTSTAMLGLWLCMRSWKRRAIGAERANYDSSHRLMALRRAHQQLLGACDDDQLWKLAQNGDKIAEDLRAARLIAGLREASA
jgi:two-component sensor histidine kinase